jgi:hypothetical protein
LLSQIADSLPDWNHSADTDERITDKHNVQNFADPEKDALTSKPIGTHTALGPSSDDDDKTIVTWGAKDPENPHHWPTVRTPISP